MNEETQELYLPEPAVEAVPDTTRPGVAHEGPLEIPISPEDLGMLLRANNATRAALQELGLGTRNLEVLRLEIAAVLAKEEAKMTELSAQVTAAQNTFNTLTKAMAAKYEVDINKKCNIDLNRGLFQVG